MAKSIPRSSLARREFVSVVKVVVGGLEQRQRERKEEREDLSPPTHPHEPKMDPMLAKAANPHAPTPRTRFRPNTDHQNQPTPPTVTAMEEDMGTVEEEDMGTVEEEDMGTVELPLAAQDAKQSPVL